MKKIFVTLLLLANMIWASNVDAERKIYQTIIKTIFPDKHTVYIWTDIPDKAKVISEIPSVKIVQNKENADFLIVNKVSNDIPKNKKIFADGYLVFKTYKKQLIGGFYWQKGRPNLVFIKNNLEKYNINLPKDLKKYIE